MTFSIIVPVFNAEKYLSRCIDSILAQSHTDYEIILVNDGSPDNSQTIIDSYVCKYPNKIKSFQKENGGAADARNCGIAQATGDYLLFVDADDYISPELLERLDNSIHECNADVIRYSSLTVYDNGEIGEKFFAPEMCGVSGEEAIARLIDHKQLFDAACFCAHKREYWTNNGFQFAKGMYQEDFGLIPEVIIKANKFTAIDYVGYFYVQTADSTTRVENADRSRKRNFDILQHFDSLSAIACTNIHDETIRKKFYSYLANTVVSRIKYTSGVTKKIYLNELRKRKVFDLLIDDSLKRRIKKLIIRLRYKRPVKEILS